MRISLDDLRKPVSDEAPCGEDLEYDNAYALMETAMQSREEQEMGDSKLEAAGPDWEAVGTHALDLLQRTRDMRVFVNLAMAALNTDGLPAFHNGLTIINDYMEEFWDEVYPLLDPDDDNDPMMRMNVLQNLDDYGLVRQGIRKSPLVELKGLGGFSLHDIDLATGAVQPAGDEEVNDMAIIAGAFADGDREALAAVSEAVEGALAEFQRMSDLWAERTDGYEQPSVDNTIETLREVSRALAEHAPAGTVASAEEAEEGAEGGGAEVVTVPGAINSTADVIMALDRICEYYRKNEPSSPIPVLLKRAQRLVSKDFYEILQDLAPDGITQFDQIRGQSE